MWHTPLGPRVLDNDGLERSVYRQLLSDLMESAEVGDDTIPPLGLPAFDALLAPDQAVTFETAVWGLVKPSIRPEPVTACLDEAAALPWAWAPRMLDRDRNTPNFVWTLEPVTDLLASWGAPGPDFETDGDHHGADRRVKE